MARDTADLRLDLKFVRRVRVARSNLVPIVGAGASIASGLPDWNELNLRLLKSFLRHEHADLELEGRDHAVAAAVLQARFGREAAVDLVRSKLPKQYEELLWDALFQGRTNYDPSSVHYEVAAGLLHGPGPRLAYTFNFDSLLSDAIDELQVRSPSKSRSTSRHHDVSVSHLHGRLKSRGEREGDLILSEQDFYRAAHGDAADRTLRQLLEEHDVLLIGLSLQDPRLRRQLLNRIEWPPAKRHKVFVLLTESRAGGSAELSERLSHQFVRTHERSFWTDWHLDVGFVPTHELLPVHIRAIRLGPDPAGWLARARAFLRANSPVYKRLYGREEQAEARELLRAVRRLVMHRYGVSRDECLGIGAFVPSPTSTDCIQLGFRLKGGLSRDEAGEGEHLQRRQLRVSPWSGVQGAAGHSYAYGVLVEAQKDSPFLDAGFTERMRETWGPARSFRSLLCIPIADAQDWVPIGVIYLSSNQPEPFWSRLPRDEYLDLQCTLRSTFRSALRYP